MNKNKNRILVGVASLVACASIVGLLTAATTIGVLPSASVPVISSAATTATNAHFGTTTNGIWPSYIAGGDIVTNLVAVDVRAFKEVTVEISGASMNTPGAATGQEVVWTIYKNVPGTSPTNAIGTSVLLEVAGLITNRFSSGTALLQVPSSLTFGANSITTGQSGYAAQLGGVTTLYIGKADATTLTNTTFYTNFNVYVNGK